MSTCSKEGVPNTTYLSIVHLIDESHVGLSVQFFNKTRRNILENPRAQVIVVAPETTDQYRMELEFERTETAGALFERVRVRLDAIASQSGMQDVFRLRGVDVYRVIGCRPIVRPQGAREDADTGLVAAVAQFMGRLAACGDLDTLLATALERLDALFGHAQSFVMVRDESGKRLYTVASHGFVESGVGSEVVIGEGLIGTAAARGIPLRTTNFARERVLSRAVREELTRIGDAGRLAREIPLPGLDDAKSQLAIPLEARGEVLGVLCLQSDAAGRFLARDESRMQLLARHLAVSMIAVGFAGGAEPAAAPASMGPPAAAPHAPGVATDGAGITVRYFPCDDSVFIDDAYLIKGVPGRIFQKLLQLYLEQHSQEFTNKEIRLEPSLKLPEFQDNLEARLVLLRRRLEERTDVVRLDHVGRGRLRLSVVRPIRLKVEV
ncbi:MAG TPA: GAF domain-containing protein [Vicinamibacterales bacterium]|nr:GAF domain-containing protein [Vicinamibacterales bacterium]